MSPTLIIVIVVIIVVVVVAAAGAWMLARRRALQQRFGPEYDRAVEESDSRLAAERELRERERRHAELELRPLSEESRARYAADWERVQARFVDTPNEAVRDADDLVTQLIAERGYPTADYDEQLAHLSVEHARVLGNYRDAHEINTLNGRGEATTEQLRQAVVYYRELFADLLGQAPVPDTAREAAAPAETPAAEAAAPAETPAAEAAARAETPAEEDRAEAAEADHEADAEADHEADHEADADDERTRQARAERRHAEEEQMAAEQERASRR